MLKRTDNTTECCSNVNAFDPVTEKCCGTIPIRFNLECCDGVSPYDPHNYKCCSGSIVPIVEPGHTECCGSISFDSTCHICNENETVVLAYDENTHMCCDGVIYAKIYEYSCCCGLVMFDSTINKCCNGDVRPRAIGEDTSCCRKLH